MRYGITTSGNLVSVWAGSFYEYLEAEGYSYAGDDRIHLTLEHGPVITVKLPGGFTFPRTDENYAVIDDAISAALNLHYS